ncbi:MAG: low molecular weight protein-tyrosine-phosphatase [Nostocoides sp.]
MTATAYGPERPYRVAVVCTGNICRSPMGEFLLREAFADAGLDHVVAVDSGGTTSWEAGSPADRRTLAVLRRNGHADLGGGGHRARQIDRSWLVDRDLLLAADSSHLRDLLRLARTDEERAKVRLFRSFDPAAVEEGTLEMDDPWYGPDRAFDQTYAEVRAALPGIIAHVRAALS